MVIQGASLSNLFSQIKYIKENLSKKDDELLGETEDLHNKLQGLLKHYERVLKDNGVELPYSKN